MIKLKICGITNSSDIHSIHQMKPTMMGFVFYKDSLRNILGANLIQDILSIDSEIKKVGVFVDLKLHEIQTIVFNYNLDMIQLYHDNIDEFQSIRANVQIIKAISVQKINDIESSEKYEGKCDYFLFDTKGPQKGGNGFKFDWQLLNSYKHTTPFILSGGIELEDVEQIKNISNKQLFGIDINSKFEINKGIKDVGKIKQFKTQFYDK